jgi:hypothetical protein
VRLSGFSQCAGNRLRRVQPFVVTLGSPATFQITVSLKQTTDPVMFVALYRFGAVGECRPLVKRTLVA